MDGGGWTDGWGWMDIYVALAEPWSPSQDKLLWSLGWISYLFPVIFYLHHSLCTGIVCMLSYVHTYTEVRTYKCVERIYVRT